MVKILPVILSGGSGTRLWPISRHGYPKQFHNFGEGYPLIISTLKRACSESFCDPIIIANEDHRFIIPQLCQQFGVNYSRLIIEPVSKNTAPAIIASAFYVSEHFNGEDVVLAVMPSDHIIRQNEKFCDDLKVASDLAVEGYISCFGISPTSPDTGYGYIKSGEEINSINKAKLVDVFIEKPDEKTAKKYIKSSDYSWNSGIFTFTAKTLLEEAKKYSPEIYSLTEKSYEDATIEMDFLRLEPDSFEQISSESIDYAVMEKTSKAAVINSNFDWLDIGTFSKLYDSYEKDSNGNVAIGKTKINNAKNCFVRSDGPLIAALGVEDLIIVSQNDVTLVADKNFDQQVKDVVIDLELENNHEATTHQVVYKPWGNYVSIASGDNFLTKIIQINSGQKLSLQKHQHRSEHWVCVSGKGKVSIDGKVQEILPNEYIYLPMDSIHRLENNGSEPLKIIEIQTGQVISEKDIKRYDDDFNRC